MATKTFEARIRLKKDSAVNWESNNPVLLDGEKIIVTTSAGQIRMKTGNGTSTYSQLPFDDEKIGLATVAKTGNYNDLSNKPTIPVVPAIPNSITLTGDVTGTGNFNGGTSASITTTVADDSHNHVIANVDGLQDKLAGIDAITALNKTMNGTAIRVDDVSPLAHNLSIVQYGQCVQDGTPTPAVPIEITGKAAGGSVYEKNLCTLRELTTGALEYANISVPELVEAYNRVPAGNYVYISYNVTCNGTLSSNAGKVYIVYTDGTTAGAYNRFLTSHKVAQYVSIYGGVQATATENHFTNIQLELGSTATAYEPYQAPVTQTVTDANGDHVTLYGIPAASGGNVTIGGQQYIADTLEGTTVTRRVSGFDGGEVDWEFLDSRGGYFRTNTTPDKATGGRNAICAAYPTIYMDLTTDEQFICGANSAYIYLKNTAYTSAAELKASLSGVMFYYELATPVTETVTLSPSALAANSPTTTWLSEAYSEVSYNSVTNRDISLAIGSLARSATTSTQGLMPAADKEKLDGIAYGANAYILPVAGSVLGGVKSGTDIIVDTDGNVSINDNSHNHIISNVNGLQNALDGKAAASHTHGAYVNQNAFSNIVVGGTTIAADSTTDSLTLVAGSNITLTPNATSDSVTIASSAEPVSVSVTQSLTSGTKVGTVTVNGTATDLYAPTNTGATYEEATTSVSGLMSSSDKTKLNGIEAGANAYVLPVASTDLGGIKSGTDITIDTLGNVTVNDDSHNHVISNVDGLQTELNNKAALSHTHDGYALTSHTHSGYESKSNIVTSLSSSSTDTQYPSAKCVYNLVAGIETLLNNINSGSGS